MGKLTIKTQEKKSAKGYSLKVRIAAALFLLVASQGLILLCSIAITGAISKNDIATYNTLSNQANTRKLELEAQFSTKRKNITNLSVELGEKIDAALLDHGIEADTLPAFGAVYTDLLDTVLSDLTDFTKYNAATGVFVILDTSAGVADREKASRACIYVRDSSPGIINKNNSNLLLECGRVDLAREKGIAVNYLWTRDLLFSDGLSRDFYFNPIDAALDRRTGPDRPQDAGYWSAPFVLKKDDISVVTYSLPLILKDGTVCGVIGFELDVNYLATLIPASEVPYTGGVYLLGVDDGDGLNTDSLVSSGAYAKQFLSGAPAKIELIPVYESEKSSVFELYSTNFPQSRALGVYHQIGLYEAYSPFFSEKWAFICMAPKDAVMSGSNSVKHAITVSIASSTVLALILASFVIFYIFNPIRLLAEKVRSINPEKPVRFGRTGLREIDRLSGAFEVLSDNVSKTAAKMFKIIELVDMPLGSFEINYPEKKVRLSDSMFRLLDVERSGEGPHAIPISAWNRFVGTLEKEKSETNADGIVETLYVTERSHGPKKWFRMRRLTENMCDIGVLLDVTDEITQKQRLEYERSHDPLTRLFNRQAFLDKAFDLLRDNSDTIGILMFADLDDLKFVNDLYGHETGDAYIKKFASFLSLFSDLGALAARMSGDEFVMFMTGFTSREAARAAFDSLFSTLSEMSIPTPDGAAHKLRVSVGLSYYPADASDIKELIRYADYAMYEIKHTKKGEVREFNIGSYSKNSFVINAKDVLNLLIEEKRVRFAFQPIVNVRTGEIFAYEALMRPTVRELRSPEEVLAVARSQSKLYQIERLTFEIIFSWLDKNKSVFTEKRLFVNTIPNQLFMKSDKDELCAGFRHLFDKVVFELAEAELSGQQEPHLKIRSFRDLGAKIALDNYGSGGVGQEALPLVEPDFLKLDMSVVRDIGKSESKQQLAKDILAYAAGRGIGVIAAGVETYEELQTVVSLGADYVQGYYLGRPEFELLGIPSETRDALVQLSGKRQPD